MKIQERLLAKYRNHILQYGDREDHRNFNHHLKNNSYISFYQYDEESSTEAGVRDHCIFICFSDSSRTGEMTPGDAYDLRRGNETFDILCVHGLSTQFSGRIIIPTNNCEPIHVPKIPWSTLLDAVVLGTSDASYLLDFAIAEYWNQELRYEMQDDLRDYLKANPIHCDIVYQNRNNKTHLMYGSDNEPIAIFKERRYSDVTVMCFDLKKFHAFLDEIISKSGIDKYKDKCQTTVIDMNADCDEYTFVPGIHGVDE